MAGIKNIIKKVLQIKPPHTGYVDPSTGYGTMSFSQEGEDLVLMRFLGNRPKGFYVDIGAHHPFRFSNTYLFYQKGWNGINVDAMPGSMNSFRNLRPRDINLEIPVSSKIQKLTYHIFNEPALNTFSQEEANNKNGLRDYKIIETVEMDTFPLSEILANNLPANQMIDFMSIDVEGLDFDVLQSNNWDKFRPEVILIESLRSSLDNIHENEVYQFLKIIGYSFVAKTFNTLFFKRD